MSSSIVMASGRRFDLARFERGIASLTPEVVASSLSKICRFCGHTTTHYSVAQHSVIVSYLVPHELALEGLFHDSAECLIGDVSSPLKRLLLDYKTIERRLEPVVFRRLGVERLLEPAVKAIVKRADIITLRTEQRDVMPPDLDADEYLEDNEQDLLVFGKADPLKEVIVPLDHEAAKELFMQRFRSLHLQRVRQADSETHDV